MAYVWQSAISLGKYGTFQSNDILGRPFHFTFEILDTPTLDSESKTGLRVVPPAEIYVDIEDETPLQTSVDGVEKVDQGDGGVEYDIVGENGEVVMRTNRRIIDDVNSQAMTMADIEAMKAQSTGSGKELIAKILDSHSALDQKTSFALAKYTLRKTKKYMKRFTVLPLDVALLAKWMLTEKEPMKIMELREEVLALIGSWSNIHCTPEDPISPPGAKAMTSGAGKWLVIDETAGLLVAYMAEKMGILYPKDGDVELQESSTPAQDQNNVTESKNEDLEQPANNTRSHKTKPPSTVNTITLLHANAQPNLSLMKYFHFDAFNPPIKHPLTDHLKILSWLQLLTPEDDAGYTEPETVTEETLQSWKSGKRSNYFRKRRRWERIKFVVDETRAGGFDGLIVASVMNPISTLRHTVPLLRGGAQVAIYSPTIESLVDLADKYSSARRTAFVTDPPDPETMPTEDFPVNPTFLLAPTIQTARCRSWQVLPGRTHPLMTGRGGAEGYVFTATRVIPAEGKIQARGKFKRRKVEPSQAGTPLVREDEDQTLEADERLETK